MIAARAAGIQELAREQLTERIDRVPDSRNPKNSIGLLPPFPGKTRESCQAGCQHSESRRFGHGRCLIGEAGNAEAFGITGGKR